MAFYQYTAKKLDGTRIKGKIQAADTEQVYHHLRSLGLYLVHMKELRTKTSVKPLSSRFLSDFSRELAVMLNAGIPLMQALNLLWQQETNPTASAVYQALYLSTAAGNDLSKGLESSAGVFPNLMIQMFCAGEQGGQLSVTAAKLAEYYEKEDKLKRQVLSSMIYPIFLFCLTIVAMIVIFTVVLPNFFELFDSMEQLPAATRALIWLSNMLLDHGLFAAVSVVGFICVIACLWKQPSVGRAADRVLLNVPLVGKLLRTVVTARFSQTLSSLYSNGIPLTRAVRIAANVLGNRYLLHQFDRVMEELYNGMPLSAALSTVNGFDSRLITGIYIGEESGELEAMLDHIAASFENSSQEATKQMATLIEPVMIVVLAVIIGIVMLSVMIPIYQYYESLS